MTISTNFKKLGSAILIGLVAQVIYMDHVLAQTTTTSFGRSKQNTTYLPDVPGASKLQSDLGGTASKAGDSVLLAIKNFINRALGLLALIALIILIYGGFKMLFNSGNDGEFKKGFDLVKNVAIALIFIGVAWLIVSGIFWFVGVVAGGTTA